MDNPGQAAKAEAARQAVILAFAVITLLDDDGLCRNIDPGRIANEPGQVRGAEKRQEGNGPKRSEDVRLVDRPAVQPAQCGKCEEGYRAEPDAEDDVRARGPGQGDRDRPDDRACGQPQHHEGLLNGEDATEDGPVVRPLQQGPRGDRGQREPDARQGDRKSTRLNSSHTDRSRMPSSA